MPREPGNCMNELDLKQRLLMDHQVEGKYGKVSKMTVASESYVEVMPIGRATAIRLKE